MTVSGRLNGSFVRGTGSITLTGAYRTGLLCPSGVGSGSLSLRIRYPHPVWVWSGARLRGTFDLDVADPTWRQRGGLFGPANDSVEPTSFSVFSTFVPDSGRGCTARAGTLTGSLVAGGSYPRRAASSSTAAR